MIALLKAKPDAQSVLNKALGNSAEQLGLTQSQLAQIIGKDRSAISRGNISPDSKAGELALYFIRCYRALYALMGGDQDNMRHWIKTVNSHLGDVSPMERMTSVAGLVEVMQYLDAIRGKV
ncbi:MAG TPA: XRE family transcriptional regulator [Limnobacter sp.]|nr:XRE family transcriptional regulator [Limnobacter sp.]